jgi:phosphonate C-P lyase system protein PhnG
VDCKESLSPKQMLAHVGQDITREERDSLLDAVGEVDVELIEPPATGLVMMTAKDCFQVPFNLGEVLITTADVAFNDKRFRGMAMGDNPEMAVLLATVDALENTDRMSPELRDAITTVHDRVQKDRAIDMQRVASTQVTFDSMKKETVEFGTLGQSK